MTIADYPLPFVERLRKNRSKIIRGELEYRLRCECEEYIQGKIAEGSRSGLIKCTECGQQYEIMPRLVTRKIQK